MSSKNIQPILDAFRSYVLSQGFSIVEEREIAYGRQYIVSDGMFRTPVDLFASGKTLVQGRPSPLQTMLKSWRYMPESQSFSSLPLFEEAPTVTPPQPTLAAPARIGSDESGKGDYFGPLVVAAVFVDGKAEAKLRSLGIRDSKLLSDNSIITLAQEIRSTCRGKGTVLSYPPPLYNALYKSMPNLNLMLARAHAQVIASVRKHTDSTLAIVDQFGDASLVPAALASIQCPIEIEQRHRAEEDTAVAAASIIARAEFVRQIGQLSHSIGFDLPKGASNPAIITIGRALVAQHGPAGLEQVAKLHFKTTEAILQPVNE